MKRKKTYQKIKPYDLKHEKSEIKYPHILPD